MPDTCVSTCTMMTRLSVPVAEIYAVISLRSTFARRYLAPCCIPHKCLTLCHPASPMARSPTIARDHFQGLEDDCPRTWWLGSMPERSRGRSSRLVMVSVAILNNATVLTIGINYFQGLEDGCLRTYRFGSVSRRSRCRPICSAAILNLEINGGLGTAAYPQTSQWCPKADRELPRLNPSEESHNRPLLFSLRSGNGSEVDPKFRRLLLQTVPRQSQME